MSHTDTYHHSTTRSPRTSARTARLYRASLAWLLIPLLVLAVRSLTGQHSLEHNVSVFGVNPAMVVADYLGVYFGIRLVLVASVRGWKQSALANLLYVALLVLGALIVHVVAQTV